MCLSQCVSPDTEEKRKTFPHTDMSGPLQVYKACTDWVRWDMESRAQYLHALLNAVHIYALPPKFLKNQLLSCPILSKVKCFKFPF